MAPLVVDIVLGPLIGTFFAVLLLGLVSMQVFFYVQHYPKDRKFLRFTVFSTWFLEVVHSGLSVEAIEHYLIANYDNPSALQYTRWSFITALIIGFIIAYVCNMCFVWGIYILSRRWSIAGFLAVFSTIRLVLGLVNCSFSIVDDTWSAFHSRTYSTVVAGWAISAANDCLIAGALCYYLHTQRTGLPRTDTLINRLLLYTVNTGLITSIFAVLVIISFTTIEGSAFIAFMQVQSKFYAISLLATLNNRKALQSHLHGTIATFDNLHSTEGQPVSFSSGPPSYPLAQMSTIDIKAGGPFDRPLSSMATVDDQQSVV